MCGWFGTDVVRECTERSYVRAAGRELPMPVTGKGAAMAPASRNTRHFGTGPGVREGQGSDSDPDYLEEEESSPVNRPDVPAASKSKAVKYQPPKPNRSGSGTGKPMVSGMKRKPAHPKQKSKGTETPHDPVPEKSPKTAQPRGSPGPSPARGTDNTPPVVGAPATPGPQSGDGSGPLARAGQATQPLANLFNSETPEAGPSHSQFLLGRTQGQQAVSMSEFARLETAFQNTQRQNDILARTLESMTTFNAKIVADKDKYMVETLKLREVRFRV